MFFRILFEIVTEILRLFRLLPALIYCKKNIRWFWDQLYLRSSFLQSIFSHRFGEYNASTVETAAVLCKISEISLVTHKTITSDGFELVLHNCRRSILSSTSGNNKQQQNFEKKGIQPSPLPPVLLVHGLMQDAESFLCGGSSSIVAFLIHAGYDVWIGNNRGTKYSTNHLIYNRTHKDYWDYCIDDLALHDVPAMISYVLNQTKYSKLAYIGFSQGSTQAFASLFINSHLHSQISLFIALSPALKTSGLTSSWLQALLHSYPHLLSHFFGSHEMLSCCQYFQQILSKQFFANIVKYSMKFLFHWSCENISTQRRYELFQHCYSPTSVKCVNHWFQIIQHGTYRRYQNYEGEGGREERRRDKSHGATTTITTTTSTRTTTRTKTRRSSSKKIPGSDSSHISSSSSSSSLSNNHPITCPIALFYGGQDTLIVPNIHEVLHEINSSVVFLHCEPSYEHLDLIWADNAPQQIFPKIIEQLRKYHL